VPVNRTLAGVKHGQDDRAQMIHERWHSQLDGDAWRVPSNQTPELPMR